jgi:hypothetical protein
MSFFEVDFSRFPKTTSARLFIGLLLLRILETRTTTEAHLERMLAAALDCDQIAVECDRLNAAKPRAIAEVDSEK